MELTKFLEKKCGAFLQTVMEYILKLFYFWCFNILINSDSEFQYTRMGFQWPWH